MSKFIIALFVSALACSLSVNAADADKKKGKKGGAAAMFKKADSDGNGSVSKDEFTASTKARMKAAADKAGKGGDFDAAWEKRSKGVDKMFAKKDANGDGSLSQEEFAKKPEGKKGEKKPADKKKKKPADS